MTVVGISGFRKQHNGTSSAGTGNDAYAKYHEDKSADSAGRVNKNPVHQLCLLYPSQLACDPAPLAGPGRRNFLKNIRNKTKEMIVANSEVLIPDSSLAEEGESEEPSGPGTVNRELYARAIYDIARRIARGSQYTDVHTKFPCIGLSDLPFVTDLLLI